MTTGFEPRISGAGATVRPTVPTVPHLLRKVGQQVSKVLQFYIVGPHDDQFLCSQN